MNEQGLCEFFEYAIQNLTSGQESRVNSTANHSYIFVMKLLESTKALYVSSLTTVNTKSLTREG